MRQLSAFIIIWCWIITSPGTEPNSGVYFVGFEDTNTLSSIQRTAGPVSPAFEGFPKDNQAGIFTEQTKLLAIKDPGEMSQFDFGNGDSITIEAWVYPKKLANGSHAYILGKGRSGNIEYSQNNQNYSLRLTGKSNRAHVSFLFRDNRSLTDVGGVSEKLWHRFTTDEGFPTQSGWHHVAISYEFGNPDSIRAFIDGKPKKGRWDMGGKTQHPPVIDNDSIFLGRGNGDSPSNKFVGLMDSVAIHRSQLPDEVLKNRFKWNHSTVTISKNQLKEGKVRMDIFENIPVDLSWKFQSPVKPTETFELDHFAIHKLPYKYNKSGIREDRKGPVLIRLSGYVELPTGSNQLMLRSLNGSRVFLNEKLIVQNPFVRGNADGHGEVSDPPRNFPENLRYPVNGHHDSFVDIHINPSQKYLVILEAIVGGKRLPQETGEISLTHIQFKDQAHYLLSPHSNRIQHDNLGWATFTTKQNIKFETWNKNKRQKYQNNLRPAWAKRHKSVHQNLLKSIQPPSIPKVRASSEVLTPIDNFIHARLEKDKITPKGQINDLAYFRKLSLDTRGIPPRVDEIEMYFSWDQSSRKEKLIDYLMRQPEWADHWVSYWQDVLAENPAILKPTLNNTGPFRFWIREFFDDNKPFDQFIKELVEMDGSSFGGGAAGFGIATQNDLPMADKAQIISQAFLAKNLSCARCHDAPFHQFTQKDLMGLAGMLGNKSIKLPDSSSVPVTDKEKHSLIDVTLKPGEEVQPHWAFGRDLETKSQDEGQLADILIRDNALTISKVFVNRVWKKYLGRGIVEPVNDWEESKPSHPELLDWLAINFIESGYDIKALSRLIFMSKVYQRDITNNVPEVDIYGIDTFNFHGNIRRRMSAEQIVDSALSVSGRPMVSERLTLDNDGKRMPNVFLNLGYPQKAWEFTGLSNDRDRPALSMPRTQEIVDFLKIFGWRETRQNPIDERNTETNSLQPASMANSQFINARAITVTDNSYWLDLALEDLSLQDMITQLYLAILTRKPNEEEMNIVGQMLESGFKDRVISREKMRPQTKFNPIHLLSWSNHLNAKATEIKLIVEKEAQKGDPPTELLHSNWRESFEDVIWSLVNSPEFIHLP